MEAHRHAEIALGNMRKPVAELKDSRLIEAELATAEQIFRLLSTRFGVPVVSDERLGEVQLPDPFKRTLWICMTIFWITLLLYVRLFKPLFMLRRPYRVTEVRAERGDTTTLVMDPDGHAGFRFKPGQFGWLNVWGSPFRITGHPFSFSSSAEAANGRVEMTIRNLGDFTNAVDGGPTDFRVPKP